MQPGEGSVEEFVMEEADRGWEDWTPSAGRGVLRDVLRAQATVLDRLLEAIATVYREELAIAGHSPERRRSERVRTLLLEGDPVDGARLDSELEYDLGGWHLGLIATGNGAARAVQELAARTDRAVLSVTAARESVWAWLGGSERLVFADIERVIADGVGSHQPGGVVFAVGEPARGLDGWRLTHSHAQAAFAVAQRRGGRELIPARYADERVSLTRYADERVALTRYADVALLAAALKDEMLAGALLEIYIAPLEDSANGGPVLRQTLHAYFAVERSVSSAAAALGVARKTVENRLRTIEEKLGRSLHPCPAELEVALLLNEIAPAPPDSKYFDR